MKKKLVLLFTTIVLLLSVLSGCTIIPSDFSNGDTSTGLEDGKVYQFNVNFSTVQGASYSSTVEMLDAVRPTVYEVYAKRDGANGVSCGSGTLVAIAEKDDDNNPINVANLNNGTAQDGVVNTCYIILTCHHVIDSTDVYLVKDIYGNSFQTYLIGGDPDSDIALIYFSPESDGWTATENENEYTKNGKTVTLKCAQIRAGTGANELKVGESVFAIGNPLGTLGGTVTQGIISATNREINVEGKVMNLIQTDCAINGGNSGGALIDSSGALVGVVNAGYSGDVEGLNFAISSSIAVDISNKLASTFTGVNYGYIDGKAKICAEFSTDLFQGNDVALYDYKIDMFTSAIAVYDVSSAYYSAGLRVGDFIKSVSYKETTITLRKSGYDSQGNYYSPAGWLVKDLCNLSVSKGETLKITVLRNDETVEVNLPIKQYIYKNTGVFAN